MDTDGAGARRGTRDNGLRCSTYVAIADLDPRVADALLEALRDHGIAAYAGPTPAASGGYMELQLPNRPIDRLYVDEMQQAKARTVIDDERPQEELEARPAPEPAPAAGGGDDDIDFDAAWAQLLTSLQQPGSDPPGRDSPAGAWGPTRITVPYPAPREQAVADDDDEDGYAPADHEHFEPPVAPPLPRLRRVTTAAITSIVAGL